MNTLKSGTGWNRLRFHRGETEPGRPQAGGRVPRGQPASPTAAKAGQLAYARHPVPAAEGACPLHAEDRYDRCHTTHIL